MVIVKETDATLHVHDDVLPWAELVPFADSNSYSSIYIQKLVFERNGDDFKASRLPTPVDQLTGNSAAYAVTNCGISAPSIFTAKDWPPAGWN